MIEKMNEQKNINSKKLDNLIEKAKESYQAGEDEEKSEKIKEFCKWLEGTTKCLNIANVQLDKMNEERQRARQEKYQRDVFFDITETGLV